MTAVKNIPTVDLNDYTSGGGAARSRLIETLGGGLTEFGFLNVEGHGIDPALIRRTYDLWKQILRAPRRREAALRRGRGGSPGLHAVRRRARQGQPAARPQGVLARRPGAAAGASVPAGISGERLAGGDPGDRGADAPPLQQPGAGGRGTPARAGRIFRDAARVVRLDDGRGQQHPAHPPLSAGQAGARSGRCAPRPTRTST